MNILQTGKKEVEKMKNLSIIINEVQEAVKVSVAENKAAGEESARIILREYTHTEIEVSMSPTEKEVIIYHYDADGTLNEHHSPLLEEKIASQLPDWWEVDYEEAEDPRCDFEKDTSANGWFFRNQL